MRFRLLGDIAVRIDGAVADLGHPRQRVVLAVLLVDVNRVVSVDRVIDRVWGERPPQRAREALYSYLSRLRRVVADVDGVDIVHHSGGYQLVADPDTVDLHRFRSLVTQARQADDDTAADRFAAALELWDGVPFGPLDSPWLDSVRDLLAHERLAAELDRNEVQLRRGRHTELLSDLTARAAEHPTNEQLAGQLMRALHASGRPADALAVFAALRARLVAELGADPSPELRQLHERLLTDDPGDDPGPAVLPRQLPAPPGRFTGRTAELAALDELLAPDDDRPGSTIAVISGVGGLGKTRLALRWAHEHADDFPDGHLYVDLRGFDPAEPPVPVEIALRGFLAALGVPAATVPREIPAQTALYRSRIAGRRMLVVLDNARDTEHVTPLLPGSPSCVTVVTSRHRLAGLVTAYGARTVAPTLLAPHEAFGVLVDALGTARVAAEPAAIAELLTHCAGLPLALTILAARASTHPTFPIAALAGELRSATDRLDALDGGEAAASLADVFACSFGALDLPLARLFASLGLVRGPDLSTTWAADLIGVPVSRARMLLRQLETVHLVEQHLPGRYRMHDLVRLYAREQARRTLTADERVAAVRRLVEACLRDAAAADRVLVPHRAPTDLGLEPSVTDTAPPNQTAALTWFDTEQASLVAAQELAAEYGMLDRTWQLAWAMSSYHGRQGRITDDMAMWRIGHAAAERSGDPAAAALANRFLGRALGRAGNYTQSLRHLQRAVDLLTELGDRFGAAHTHRSMAWTWAQQDDVAMALTHASEAAKLYQELDAPVWFADALDLVGWYHAQLGDYELAASESERALAIHREHDNTEGEANALDSLGYIAHHTGRPELAIDRYLASLTACRSLGATVQEAETLVHLGEVYASTGQNDQAAQAWREALDLYRDQCRAGEVAAVEAKLAALTLDLGWRR
ncbi:MAG TPA: BTAD domain-containing putative transcriptional regulator [Pseudonocardiaceae bacterium]|nr:BTAD domain-containing putative transcriptional regulator [Pseudonocardiaceae bacterium]